MISQKIKEERKFFMCKENNEPNNLPEENFDSSYFRKIEEEKKKLKESLEIKDNDFVIIYVAELSKRKNQESM